MRAVNFQGPSGENDFNRWATESFREIERASRDGLPSAFVSTLLDDADAATARGTLGLGSMALESTASYVPAAGGTFTGAVGFNSSAAFNGGAGFNSTATFSLTATFNGAVGLNSTATFASLATFNGAAAFNSSATFGLTATFNGATTFNSTGTFNGAAAFSSTATFSALATFNGAAAFNSTATFNAGVISATLDPTGLATRRLYFDGTGWVAEGPYFQLGGNLIAPVQDYTGAANRYEIYESGPNRVHFVNLSIFVDGDVGGTTKSFRIVHPSKPNTTLTHGAIEGPEYATFYRGRGTLTTGAATVALPDYFPALCDETSATVQVTPIAVGGQAVPLAASAVSGGQFSVCALAPLPPGMLTQEFFWLVQATRQDVAALQVEAEGSPLDVDTSLSSEAFTNAAKDAAATSTSRT